MRRLARAAAIAVGLAAIAAAPRARALGGTAFGEASRAAGVANSAVARPGDASTLVLNPAGLADQDEPIVAIAGQAGRLQSWFQRAGEPRADRNRWIGGYGFAVGTPLPGSSWLHHVRFGLAAHLPAAHVLQVTVPERADTPSSPIYDARPERVSMALGLAADPLPWLKVGAAIVLVPTLTLPTEVTYVSGRSASPETDLTIRLDRKLEMAVAPILGLRVEPDPRFGFGLVWRARAQSTASGNNRTVAGAVLADDPLRYTSFWDASAVAVAAMARPVERLSLSVDVERAGWSSFRDGFDDAVDPTFRDVWNVRAGAELRASRGLLVRAGWGLEPTPVPDQVAYTNYLDATTQVVAAGAGVDLRELVGAPLALDAHVRTRLGATQSATKDPARQADADPALAGKQIDDLGYPAYASQARFFQAGLTLTIFVGKKKETP